MYDLVHRFWQQLMERTSGPLHFRFLLQPTVAALLAVRGGIKDARAGRPPYFWALFTHPETRGAMLRDGWSAIAKVFVIAVVLDVLFQLVVFKWLYPVQTLVIAVVLALVPYILLRGPANRIARRLLARRTARHAP